MRKRSTLVILLALGSVAFPTIAVGKPAKGLSLVLDKQVVRPSERLTISVRNRGDQTVSSNTGYRPQTLVNGSWILMPGFDGGFKKRRFTAAPGTTKRLSQFYAPFEAVAGSYRIVKKIGGRRLVASFTVATP